MSGGGSMRRWFTSLLVLGLLAPGSALAQGSSSSFSQLTGERGCFTQEPPLPFDDEPLDGCARTPGLIRAHAVAVSPDDKQLYAASSGSPGIGSNALVTFGRAGDTGALTPAGCISDTGGDGRTGTDGFCADGDALLGASDLALSGDGRSLYVVSANSAGVTWFERDAATGKLTPGGCIKDFPRNDHCLGSSGLVGASGVAVSPDGRNVYVTASTARSLLAFARNQADGTLKPQACLLDDAPKGGSCTDAPALDGAAASAISPDGRTLFVASSDDGALALFDRDPATGALKPGTCFRHEDPQGDDAVDSEEEEEEDTGDDEEEADEASTGDCRPAKALGGAHAVAVAPDGRAVFVAGADSLAAFQRNPSTGALEQFGCAEDERSYKSCAQANGVSGASGLAVTSDGRSLYVANDT